MVLPTSDCKTILVALEAEAYPNMDASQLIDPPGGIGIIKFSTSDLSQTPTYKTVDFSSFNNRYILTLLQLNNKYTGPFPNHNPKAMKDFKNLTQVN